MKEEIREVVDFLRDATQFSAMGAQIPKGILLVGPPGTGKTLFARAVAGEANVPFISITGSGASAHVQRDHHQCRYRASGRWRRSRRRTPEGIVVLAATNRPDVLDPALLLDEQARRASDELTARRAELDGVATALLEHETLEGDHVREILARVRRSSTEPVPA